MPKFILRISLCMVCLSILFGGQTFAHDKHHLTADGPYIIYRPDGSVRVVSVSVEGIVTDTILSPHSPLLTPLSSLLTPHSSLLTPHSSRKSPIPREWSRVGLPCHFSRRQAPILRLAPPF